MNIIGTYKLNSCLFMHTHKLRIDIMLFRNSVVLQFKEEITLTKYILKL